MQDASDQPAAPQGMAEPAPVVRGPGTRPVPQAALITERTRHQLAQQHALGMPISEMAELHGLEPRKLSQLFRTDEMKALVQSKQTDLVAAGSRVMFKFLLHAEQLAQAQVDCALQDGPDQYKARTWILERIAPARSTSQSSVDVNVNVNAEVMHGLTAALKETAKVLELRPTTDGIALLDGKSAMPPANYEMDAVELEQ